MSVDVKDVAIAEHDTIVQPTKVELAAQRLVQVDRRRERGSWERHRFWSPACTGDQPAVSDT